MMGKIGGKGKVTERDQVLLCQIFLKLWFSFYETSLGQGWVRVRLVKFQNKVGARLIHYYVIAISVLC